MANEVILYLTHKINACVLKEFAGLKAHAGSRRVVLLYHGKNEGHLPHPHFCCSDEDLGNLGYCRIGENLIPGHVHFPFFNYFKEDNSWDYYWLIEYDVRFTGKWNYLFDSFEDSEADFITSRIRNYKEYPSWPWWKLNHPAKTIPMEERISSFNPIYRISKPGANFLDQAFLSGWTGHQEVIIPTLLNQNGFKLLDFGGNGPFANNSENKFYTNYSFLNDLYVFGTFRYRPARKKAGFRRNKLYHPVKSNSKSGFIRNLRFFKYRLHERFGS